MEYGQKDGPALLITMPNGDEALSGFSMGIFGPRIHAVTLTLPKGGEGAWAGLFDAWILERDEITWEYIRKNRSEWGNADSLKVRVTGRTRGGRILTLEGEGEAGIESFMHPPTLPSGDFPIKATAELRGSVAFSHDLLCGLRNLELEKTGAAGTVSLFVRNPEGEERVVTVGLGGLSEVCMIPRFMPRGHAAGS